MVTLRSEKLLYISTPQWRTRAKTRTKKRSHKINARSLSFDTRLSAHLRACMRVFEGEKHEDARTESKVKAGAAAREKNPRANDQRATSSFCFASVAERNVSSAENPVRQR